MATPLRIGSLGAAHMAQVAIARPSRGMADVVFAAVAARDSGRAARWARRQGVARVHPSYAALLADPAIDAVYVPLPNSLHAEWALRALAAGKHVLCEKPLAANASEAQQLADAAEASGLVLMEAMHYRYHPLAARLRALLDGGIIGTLRHIDAEFSAPLLQPRSIQFRADLAGGATMDVGCYVLDLLRLLVGAEPVVQSATARLLRPEVDRLMRADLAFPSGCTARMTCALLSARGLRLGATVYGTTGTLRVIMPWLPHYFNLIVVKTARGTTVERVPGRTTYAYQLEAFARAIRDGVAPETSAQAAVGTMRAIDAVYRAAGMRPRGAAHTAPPEDLLSSGGAQG
jgi:predicted dehydrogenase